MPRQNWSEAVVFATADGTAIANTTTETSIFTAPTVLANYMADSRRTWLKASGKHSTTGTPTLTFGLRWGTATGGVLLAQSAAITCGSGVSNVLWELELEIQVRLNGAAGTAMATGWVAVGSASVVFNLMCSGGAATPAVATCDFTADTLLSLTAKWSAASASNTLTGVNYKYVSDN